MFELWALNETGKNGYLLSVHSTINEASEEMDKWILSDEGIFDSDVMKNGSFKIVDNEESESNE